MSAKSRHPEVVIDTWGHGGSKGQLSGYAKNF